MEESAHGTSPKKAKKIRAAFDFETFGWTPEEGEDEVEVEALVCAFVYPDPTDFQVWKRAYVKDDTHVPGTRQAREGQKTVGKALLFMARQSHVEEWWAHYSHGFDTLHLMAAAKRMAWKREVMGAGQGIIRVKLTSPKNEEVVVQDLFRVLQSKLRDIAEDFELPSRKLFGSEDYKGDMRDLSWERLLEGCLTDAQLVMEALDKVEALAHEFGGRLAMTFSSTALSALRGHMKAEGRQIPQMRHSRNCAHGKRRKLCDCYWSANIRAKKSYAGARVEVLHHMPKGLLTEYDRASSYPASMVKPLPWKWLSYVEGRLAEEAYRQGYEGVYHAKVTVPPMRYPPLPFKLQGEGLFFPVGTWAASFAACELRYAEKLGVKVEILWGDAYTSDTPFASFVEQIYEVKRTAKGAKRQFAKLLLNGCYGKFAEKPERERTICVASATEAHRLVAWEGFRFQDEDVDPTVLVEEKLSYAKHAHYAVGSYITAYSRIALHEVMVQSQNLAYVDTDAVHVSGWAGTPGEALGEWKVELSEYEGIFLAPKLYFLVDPQTGLAKVDGKGRPQVACKGYPRPRTAQEAQEVFEAILGSAQARTEAQKAGATKGEAMELAKGLGIELIRTRMLRTQIKPGEDATKVVRRREVKTWAGSSKKRKPRADGSTVPWTVDELMRGEHRSALSPWV